MHFYSHADEYMKSVKVKLSVIDNEKKVHV